MNLQILSLLQAALGGAIHLYVTVHDKRDLVLHLVFERMPTIKWLLLNQILLKDDKTFYAICSIILLVV